MPESHTSSNALGKATPTCTSTQARCRSGSSTSSSSSNLCKHDADAASVEAVSINASPLDRSLTRQLLQRPRAQNGSANALDPETVLTRRRLVRASLLCFIFFVIELIGGLVSNSLAILSDSFHLLSDLSGFLVSLFAVYLAQQRATKRHSFGFHRAEIIGAVVSVLLIWVVTGFLVNEAVQRLVHKSEPINGKIMLGIAIAGLIVNFTLIFALGHGHSHGHCHSHSHDHGGSNRNEQGNSNELESLGSHVYIQVGGRNVSNDSLQTLSDNNSSTQLHATRNGHAHHHHHTNVNIRAAVLHVIGDIISSIGVLVSSIIIVVRPDLAWVDPACTFLFSAVVMATTFKLIKDSVAVLMEGTPPDIDPAQVEQDIRQINGVINVHDLHIWTLTVGKPAIAVHVEIADFHDTATPNDVMVLYDTVLMQTQNLLCEKYHVHHTTIQVESRKVADAAHCTSSICNGGVCTNIASSASSNL